MTKQIVYEYVEGSSCDRCGELKRCVKISKKFLIKNYSVLLCSTCFSHIFAKFRKPKN